MVKCECCKEKIEERYIIDICGANLCYRCHGVFLDILEGDKSKEELFEEIRGGKGNEHQYKD